MGKRKQNTYEKFTEALIQLCVLLTCFMAVMGFIFPIYKGEGAFVDFFVVMVLALGSVGIYFPIGWAIKRFYDEVFER